VTGRGGVEPPLRSLPGGTGDRFSETRLPLQCGTGQPDRPRSAVPATAHISSMIARMVAPSLDVIFATALATTRTAQSAVPTATRRGHASTTRSPIHRWKTLTEHMSYDSGTEMPAHGSGLPLEGAATEEGSCWQEA
jgi:hypothetical protein